MIEINIGIAEPIYLKPSLPIVKPDIRKKSITYLLFHYLELRGSFTLNRKICIRHIRLTGNIFI